MARYPSECYGFTHIFVSFFCFPALSVSGLVPLRKSGRKGTFCNLPAGRLCLPETPRTAGAARIASLCLPEECRLGEVCQPETPRPARTAKAPEAPMEVGDAEPRSGVAEVGAGDGAADGAPPRRCQRVHLNVDEQEVVYLQRRKSDEVKLSQVRPADLPRMKEAPIPWVPWGALENL